MSESTGTNAPEISVTELSGALKRTIEDAFGHVRVRGEISGYRGPHSSGHCYFSLKDQGARIEAVIWKGVFGRMKIRPEEGLEVIATGKITTFPGSSKYQIVIEAIEPAGVGALMALLEERRRKLAAEGLFDEARKRKIPFLPKVIGVVTSPTGAVIRDILHRIADRFPRHVLVWPVRVQGETCAEEVSVAIDGFNALEPGGPLPRPDVLIVARGGGSLEDLWGFNEEKVVRAAANSKIPLISAIGHETDWTLLDHVADLRAPTPTGAAEKAVPVRSELLGQVNDFARRLSAAALRGLERKRNDVRSLARALPQPEDLVALPRQRLDRADEKLRVSLLRGLDQRRLTLANLGARLADKSPRMQVLRARQRIDLAEKGLQSAVLLLKQRKTDRFNTASNRLAQALHAYGRVAQERQNGQTRRLTDLAKRLETSMASVLTLRKTRLTSLEKLMNSLGHRQVLARGFAIVRDADNHPVRSIAAFQPGVVLNLELADGRTNITPTDAEQTQITPEAAPPKPAPKRKSAPKSEGQGSLF